MEMPHVLRAINEGKYRKTYNRGRSLKANTNDLLTVFPEKPFNPAMSYHKFHIFPKLMPKCFKSIEILERDEFPLATYKVEKREFLDEANMTTTHTVQSGEIMNEYKTYKRTLKVIPGATSGTFTVKWIIEYEPAHEGEVVHPEKCKKTAVTPSRSWKNICSPTHIQRLSIAVTISLPIAD
ncbi:MLP-like protein 34 [Cryptomeria japonica]|uniref:MLP-like protein 34 n=1 Tax=Cryptomeria japonica TaxID=3369 RepID=UPI0025ABA694|nr:MLP-like protein 34 [Cryptomeria japonica]